MTTANVLGTEPVTTAQPVHEPIGERRDRKRPLLPIIYWVVIGITMIPILVMIVYSFNNTPTNRITFQWHGFTTYWYQNLTQVSGLGDSFIVSIEIAVLSAIISIAIGSGFEAANHVIENISRIRQCSLSSRGVLLSFAFRPNSAMGSGDSSRNSVS